ncbi:MAG: arylamine N-acetyltransferase [Betaproteobacteria bacterium]|nr:MAG: arylamine N-acetyltransferase [Betaproteobacteria bacterium]
MAGNGQIDIERYFERVGYDGPRAPSLDTLNRIAAAHVSSMPFNNIGILRGQPVRLDAGALNRKLVMDGLGGYCFEQNGVLEHVLSALGYDVAPLGARVRLGVPRSVVPPRTHYFLRVDLDGAAWLVDVGFGALSLTSAIRFERGIEQPTPHETRRVVEEDGRLFHQVLLAGTWIDAYEFTLDAMHPIDREVANWWTSTNPASRFRNRLIVARAGPKGTRLTIDNDEFTIRGADGVGDSRAIGSPAELLAILDRHFGLAFPAGTHFDIPGHSWPEPR